jgi:hypothetical protein
MTKRTEHPPYLQECVDWCMKRCDGLSFEDTTALLSEFDEWIEYLENDEIKSLDIIEWVTS